MDFPSSAGIGCESQAYASTRYRSFNNIGQQNSVYSKDYTNYTAATIVPNKAVAVDNTFAVSGGGNVATTKNTDWVCKSSEVGADKSVEYRYNNYNNVVGP